MSRNYFAAIILIAGALMISACNTTKVMHIPSLSGQSDVTRIKTPKDKQASFTLGKVVASIKRGTSIVNFPPQPVEGAEGWSCNMRHQGESTIEWGSGTSFLGDWRTELGEIFFESISSIGLNIMGDPSDMFEQGESARSADYLIGARITEIRGNACENHHWWDGRPLDEYSGEMYMDVEWSLYSNLRKETVLSVNTQGYYKLKRLERQGIMIMFNEAFANSSEQLMAQQAFLKVVNRQNDNSLGTIQVGAPLDIPLVKSKDIDIAAQTQEILASVVTIRRSSVHGSGFFISKEGHILTNAHVVGDAKTVMIIANNGLEIRGKVLRSHEPRDVALIKIPVKVREALAIRESETILLEQVYAIGSPLLEEMHSTITKGIISAYRKFNNEEYRYIQSDTAISGGNSGGPMLDSKGRVVAISVAGFDNSISSGLNLFIPIKEALEALKIRDVTDPGV